MRLRNFDFAIRYFDYPSRAELEDVSNPPINGWYKLADGLLTGLLVSDHKLYFLFEEEQIFITEACRVSLKRSSPTENEFGLVRGEEVVVKFLYALPSPKLNPSPFEYLDDDNGGWEEFIAQVINDKERQRNFVGSLMEKS